MSNPHQTFHILPTVRQRIQQRRRPPPPTRENAGDIRLFGLALPADSVVILQRVGALLLFWPTATAIYSDVARNGSLTVPALLMTTVGSIVAIAYPVLWLKKLVATSHSRRPNA